MKLTEQQLRKLILSEMGAEKSQSGLSGGLVDLLALLDSGKSTVAVVRAYWAVRNRELSQKDFEEFCKELSAGNYKVGMP
jgi:hypothetical protein